MTTIVNNLSYAAKEPGIPGAEVPSALFHRLDLVDDELERAENVTAALVRQLEPVLPLGFGTLAVMPPEAKDIDPSSPLTIRLADLAARGERLVRQLQGVCEAVDL